MGLCRRWVGDRDLQHFGGEGGRFPTRGTGGRGVGGFLASRVCCRWDDALGNSGGTVADRTMVQAIVEVPTVRRKGKENELLGNK